MLCGSFFGRSTSPATLAKKKKNIYFFFFFARLGGLD